jgi:flagellar biosynthetic protein FliP
LTSHGGSLRAWKTAARALLVLTLSAPAAIAQDGSRGGEAPLPPQASAPVDGAPIDGATAAETPAARSAGWPQEVETTAATEPPPAAPPAEADAEEETSTSGGAPIELPFGLGGPEAWTSPEGLSSALATLALLAVVSLAPALLLMTTCFVRIVIVLGLVRQALGSAQLPPNQVTTSIALFMTLLVMTPVWSEVYDEAIVPYTSHEITVEEAWDAGIRPVRGFMSAQIERTGNSSDVWLFYNYLPQPVSTPSSYDDVPLQVLLPAFMLSELKTAFLIGFQIYLPFLVLDLVVASVTISMGMVMLPPMLVSLPLKLLLFVLVDGWHLVVGMLLESFQTLS